MYCPLTTWLSAIILQFYGALVILIDNIVMDITPLLFQEVLDSYHLGQDTDHSDKLGLSWYLSVKLLFSGLDICTDRYHGNETTSVATHILVHYK